ncbi:uncharacterized protein PHALS_14411 [Plasmopara halstedii]|uniref:Uncharacterized protein n=1 Tax=Plasmopara halstedii TaxID=4781 RepID=A0A0P1ARC7_PLAHL|nr:uncharacterized protein PHALS_14411 [Plasmopara halstedii]CEG44150.1 hypothetical protein PHALS_14411 [Plasmopara halstedii]|eukprot:XP_024580519.1 hypothetical protein PHALS_14411 [Plasmopara halstedii]
MAAESETKHNRPKQSWNSSTKLAQPQHSVVTVKAQGRQATDAPSRATVKTEVPQVQPETREICDERRAMENDQQTLTRELLERAVSTAFGGLLKDFTLDNPTVLEDESQMSELSSTCDNERMLRVSSPVTNIEAKLRAILAKSTSLSANYHQKWRDHSDNTQQAERITKVEKEFQRRMKDAVFKHHERKMALHALQARIKREIEYLISTAVDLEKKEVLLDEALENYERALRQELGVSDKSKQSRD